MHSLDQWVLTKAYAGYFDHATQLQTQKRRGSGKLSNHQFTKRL
jgi:hypothetical protein